METFSAISSPTGQTNTAGMQGVSWPASAERAAPASAMTPSVAGSPRRSAERRRTCSTTGKRRPGIGQRLGHREPAHGIGTGPAVLAYEPPTIRSAARPKRAKQAATPISSQAGKTTEPDSSTAGLATTVRSMDGSLAKIRPASKAAKRISTGMRTGIRSTSSTRAGKARESVIGQVGDLARIRGSAPRSPSGRCSP